MSDDNKNIDDIIKGGFDDTNDDFNLDSWDDLAERMDQNGDLDSSIAAAFNTSEEEVPTSVWSNVNDDLDVNTVWNRIDAALTKRKRRAIIWWNAASIAFALLIIGGLLTRQSIDQLYTVESLIMDLQKFEFDSSTNISSSDNLTNSSIASTTDDQMAAEVSSYLTDAEKSKLQQIDDDFYKTEKPTNQNKSSEKDHIFKTPLEEQIDHDRSLTISSLAPKILRFSNPFTPAKLINTLNTLDSDSNQNKRANTEAKDDPSRKWLIGVKGSVVNSAIIDGLSSEASSQNSLVSNNFTVSLNPAIFAQYNLRNGYFLQSDIYWNYRVRRSVNTYDQLEYVSNTTELDYFMLNLKVGRSFNLSQSALDTKFNVALGGYWDYLKSQREYRGQTLISDVKSYNTNNYGIAAEIAVQHNYNRFSFSYGTQVDMGLQNINKTSAKLNSGFNTARTFSYGLFFRLGYRL